MTLQVFFRRRQAPVELCSRGGVRARRGPPGERAHEQQADEAAGQAQRARKHGVFILSLPPQMRTAARIVTFSLLVAGFASAVPALQFDPVVFEEVAAARGRSLRDELQPLAPQAPARDDGLGRRPVRLRQRRLARHLRRERRQAARPREVGPRVLEPPVPEQRRRHVHGRHRRPPAWRAAATTSASRPATTTTTGDTDLFVAGLRRNTLFHNNGDGTFSDVTEAAGLARPDPKYGTLWAVAAAFLDYDRDGRLDLFVSNYCVWDPAKEPVCGNPAAPDYCHPRQYQGLPNSLFHNNGDGTFSRRLRRLRDPRARRQGHGRRRRRLRRRRLDGRLRRQRHGAVVRCS